MMRRFLATAVTAAALGAFPGAAEPTGYLTYDNTPLGTLEKPLLLRTYLPDPGLGEEVFAHHGKGTSSPRYNAGSGQDQKGEYQPVKGIPAAIGVNHGAALSYCFDTTECRLLYAWQGGFLDMFPYWGDPSRGNRQSFNYVPHLVGNLFYKASGAHPLHIDGKALSSFGRPAFLGYRLVDARPEFQFQAGENKVTLRVIPGDAPHSFQAEFSVAPPVALAYRTTAATVTVDPSSKPGLLRLTITHRSLASYQGFPRDMKITEANAANGRKLYLSYGCVACHSTDGSKGHGPTLAKLFGSRRAVEGDGDPVLADETYLLESIKDPNAVTAEGYPPGYMPPYQLKELEYQSLVQFIKSLAQPE